MRIIIEFEEKEATMKQAQTSGVSAQSAPVPTGPGDSTPPADVLATAAATGAQNAGPAPTAVSSSPGIPQIPMPTTGPEAQMSGAQDMTAGAAASTLLDAPHQGGGEDNY